MKNKKATIIQDLFLEHLQIINGIKLTHREIDIIAFFICGRSAKKIAAFFSISPKTVENHTHNIMLKLGCNSRESIIDFIEKSGKFPILRKYYTTILAQAIFCKCLKNISKATQAQEISCIIAYSEDESFASFLASYFENSLREVGIQINIQNCDSLQIPKESFVISIVSSERHETEKTIEGKNAIFLFIPGEKNPIEIIKDLKETKPLDFINDKQTFFLIFQILKRLLPAFKFDKILNDFQNEFEHIESLDGFKPREYAGIDNRSIKDSHTLSPHLKLIFSKKKRYIIAFLFLIVLAPLILVLKLIDEKFLFNKWVTTDQKVNTIRSELIIPAESVFLDRCELMSQIKDKFKEKDGIQTIALVGIGGAGKTTLASQYARGQKASGIWEIHAETPESLKLSFENLAQALLKTNETRNILEEIRNIKDPDIKERKIIQLVKEQLFNHPNWFLIYDNVEKFADIQKYFPQDSETWGYGKIILTTRDSNIQNNKHIDGVVEVGELNADQKFHLFTRIMTQGNQSSFTSTQAEEARAFLESIPPFPLDVSVAACYLKTMNTSYADYLKSLMRKEFVSMQENLLKEAGNYTKTRYEIIALPVQHLIQNNDDFRDLLLFIALLDSQHIPRHLLIHFKNAAIVDDLIYHLKKYSLITNEASLPYYGEPGFSIHRSTQAIMLGYLVSTLDRSDNRSLFQNIAASLEKYMTDIVDKEDFAKMKILSRHAEKVLDHNLINGATRALIEGNLGCIYYYLRYSTKAKKLLTTSLETLKTYSPQNHNQIAYFLVYLGCVYRDLGDYEKAKELFEKSLSLYNKSSRDPLGLARASGYLAAIYQGLGEFKKAQELLERSLAIYKNYPEKPIRVGWSLAHLGSVYKSLGDYEKAKELFERSLAIYKKYSPDHVGAAWAASDLGDTYIKLKNYQKAQDLLQESLNIYKKHFSEDHIYVAKVRAHFGIFYREKGDYKKAKEDLKKSLVAFERTYGKNHLKTGFILKDLGQTYLMEENLDTAEEILTQAFDIFEKNKHLDQYMVLESLAALYMNKYKRMQDKKDSGQQEQYKKQAIAYLEKALEGIKAYLPEDSAHVLRVKTNLNAYRQVKIRLNNPLEEF